MYYPEDFIPRLIEPTTRKLRITWDQLSKAEESLDCKDPRRFLRFTSIDGQSVAGRVIGIKVDLSEDIGPEITVFLP